MKKFEADDVMGSDDIAVCLIFLSPSLSLSIPGGTMSDTSIRVFIIVLVCFHWKECGRLHI